MLGAYQGWSHRSIERAPAPPTRTARAMPIKVWIDPQWIESLNAPANAKPGCNIARVLALASRDEVGTDLDAMLHNPPWSNGV